MFLLGKESFNEFYEQDGAEIRTVRDSESHVLYRDPVCCGRTGPDDGTGILHPVPDVRWMRGRSFTDRSGESLHL